MPGLTDTGFTKPTLADGLESVQDNLLARFGADVNLLPTSGYSQLAGVSADNFDQQWQGQLDLFNGFDPDTVGGALLRYICKLTGVIPLAATNSTVTLTVNLDATTTLTVGRLVSNPTTGVSFTTTAAVTSTTSGNYPVAAEASLTGPVAAAAGALTQIDTPVTGWNTVTNAADAIAGIAAETDPELRLRRAASVAVQGSTPKDAIRADVLGVLGVTECIVLENDTDAVDANGLPKHSFEVVTDGTGTAADIAAKIFEEGKAAGIRTYGSRSTVVVDSEGNSKTIYDSVATPVSVYVDVALTKNTDYPVDGDTQVEDAVAAYAGLTIGVDLFASALYGAVYSVAGVVNVTALTVGLSDVTAASTVAAGVRDLLGLAAVRVDVVST